MGAQLLSYLKLTGLPAGLLINFQVPHLKNGIKRLVNNPLIRAVNPAAGPRTNVRHRVIATRMVSAA